FEPEDPHHFIAPNIFADRLYNFEAWLVEIFRAPHQEDLLRSYWQPMHAYMEWRLGQYNLQNPQADALDAVILLFRFYTTPPQDGEPRKWAGPAEKKFVRGRPGRVPADHLPLELFDKKTRQFVGVKVQVP